MNEPRERRPMSRFERLAENFAKSKIGGWYFLNIANPVDKRLLPLTKGRFSLSGPASVAQVGLLTSVGAKSGQERKTPLAYVPDGDRVILIASKAGSPKHPAWYHNLKANPEVKFLSKQGDQTYTASVAKGKERDRLWVEVNDYYAGYETYQGRTGGREIPLMILEPKG